MEQPDVFRHTIDALERLGIVYLVVGSFASIAYGEPRSTRDIDIVVDLRPEQVKPLCDAFPAPEFYVSEDAAREAIRQRGQFNVIHPDSGNKVDFMIARGDAWSREQIARRRRLRLLPDQEGFAARPEDVILGKMLYYQEGGSEKHLRDIAGILKNKAVDVDRNYVVSWAEALGVLDVWQAVLARVSG